VLMGDMYAMLNCCVRRVLRHELRQGLRHGLCMLRHVLTSCAMYAASCAATWTTCIRLVCLRQGLHHALRQVLLALHASWTASWAAYAASWTVSCDENATSRTTCVRLIDCVTCCVYVLCILNPCASCAACASCVMNCDRNCVMNCVCCVM
jgi:hypothetical protein